MHPDLLMFFDQKPLEFDLYLALEAAVLNRFPETQINIQKTQISFRCKRIFACASLPVRRKKNWPEHCIILTFGLPQPLASPRIAALSPISPRRFTHHVLIAQTGAIDDELLSWLDQAFALADRPGKALP